MDELVVHRNIIEETKVHRLCWLGHFDRMGVDRKVQRAYLKLVSNLCINCTQKIITALHV